MEVASGLELGWVKPGPLKHELNVFVADFSLPSIEHDWWKAADRFCAMVEAEVVQSLRPNHTGRLRLTRWRYDQLMEAASEKVRKNHLALLRGVPQIT